MERTEPALVQQERGDRQSENAYRGVDEHPTGSQGGPGAGCPDRLAQPKPRPGNSQ